MIIYNIRVPVSTPSATATTNLTTIYPGTVRSFLLLEIDFEGQYTSSVNAEFGIYRTGNTAVPGSLSPTAGAAVPIDNVATNPVFTGSVYTGTFTTTPPTLGNLVHSFGLNSNGQRYFWRANPNANNAVVVSGNTALTGGLTIVLITGSTPANCIFSARIQIGEL